MQRNALLRRGYNSFWSHSHRQTLGTSLGMLRQQANLITTWSPVYCEHTRQTSFRLFRAGWIVAFGQPRVLDGGSQYERIERLIKTPLLEHRDFTGTLLALRDYSGLSIPREEISVQYLGSSPFLTFLPLGRPVYRVRVCFLSCRKSGDPATQEHPICFLPGPCMVKLAGFNRMDILNAFVTKPYQI